ncbi:conserved hypothetical protein [Rhodopseudomonas palustris HaA2]|uniref:Uncharacterized protein n=1 Tax=Rhodopseudomonas palustris (strain HaA2) TaxID=316058 RepID=Q2J2V8_RHOP2|nr:hypothetical protein [Rhodopseudomonas palustris]ABD05202.1 conserved hypothetical protein [Rhodopseudomonas palustris HaA2]
MTDASALPKSAFPKPALPASAAATHRMHGATSRRAVALIVAAAAIIAALVATLSDATSLTAQQADPELVMLLRFMAGVKALLALAALGAAVWRLGYPTSPTLTLGYTLAPALMCAAPVVIWQIAHVGVGAALFHAGFVLLLLALYADRGEATELAKSTVLRLRRA